MVTKVGFPGSSVKAYRNYIFGYINYSSDVMNKVFIWKIFKTQTGMAGQAGWLVWLGSACVARRAKSRFWHGRYCKNQHIIYYLGNKIRDFLFDSKSMKHLGKSLKSLKNNRKSLTKSYKI